MAENKMKEVAKLLGVEIGVPFRIEKNKKEISPDYNPFIIKDNGLYDRDEDFCYSTLIYLLNGTYEIKKSILTEKEKRYLEGVIEPFKDRVISIQKRQHGNNLFIALHVDDNYTPFPDFKNGTMYKGMEVNKHYTLEELRLFEEE